MIQKEETGTLTDLSSRTLYKQNNNISSLPDLPALTAGICRGTVTAYSTETAELTVEIEGRTFPARKAFSLLLDPMPGDSVLCHAVSKDMIYATQILESCSDADRTVTLPERVSVMTSGEIDILAQCIEMNAREIQINAVKSVTTSQKIEMQTDVMALQSQTLHDETGTRIVTSQTLKETVVRNACRHYGTDQLTVDGASTVTAQKYILNSKGTVQINGSKIDLG